MKLRKKHLKIFLLVFLLLLVIIGIAARAYLSIWVTDYVNKELNSLDGYRGSVSNIDIHLFRGAYTIHNMKLNKISGHIPVPFADIKTMDLSVEWRALFEGRIVSEIAVDRAALNFAVNPAGTSTQAGEGVSWDKEIKKLVPIDINRVTIKNSKITYKNFSTDPKVDLYINDINGEVRNLRNVEDKNAPLPSAITFSGKSIGKGKLSVDGKMNVLKTIPDMNIVIKLENVNLPSLNDYFKAFAGIDVEKGIFNTYCELSVKNGQVSGYVKPIAQHVSLIDLKKDANPIKLIWESLASVVMEIFTNHKDEQFATKIPLSGNIENVETGTWEAIVGIVRNAFVEALKKGPDGTLKNLKATPEK